MISADLLRIIIKCSYPVFVITVIIILTVKMRKNEKNNIYVPPAKLYGMRPPTDEEAERIKAQIMPRARRLLIVTSLIFIPLVVIISGAAVSGFEKDKLSGIVMACVALSILAMYLALLSMPLSEIRSLRKRLYSVSDCYIADIMTYIRRNKHGSSRIYHAVIKDQDGSEWETDLPKDLIRVSAGTKCLVIIYDSEEKVNRSRKSGKTLYRRALYVPEQ